MSMRFPGAHTEAKKARREAITHARRALTDDDRRRRDEQRTTRLLALTRPGPGRVLSTYLSAGCEPDTRDFATAALAAGARVLVPWFPPEATGATPEPDWAWFDPDDLREAPGGLVSPAADPLGARALRAADVVVVPALAVTRLGVRLGTGGGWYDRALGRAEAEAWALVSADEVCEELPLDPWDRPVTGFVTENETTRCR